MLLFAHSVHRYLFYCFGVASVPCSKTWHRFKLLDIGVVLLWAGTNPELDPAIFAPV